jgi:23S rRNA G2445 N2-methylase RlmL
MLCSIDRYRLIVDPLCGSGTLIIEAAQQLFRIPPGLHREFAFYAWPSFKPNVWNRIKELAEKKIDQGCQTVLLASDRDQKAVLHSQANASRARVRDNISFSQQDCRVFNRDSHGEAPALLISNLPYGKRIGSDEQVSRLYKEFGTSIQHWCKGWDFGLLVPDTPVSKKLGLSVRRSFTFSHGGIRVAFIQGSV